VLAQNKEMEKDTYFKKCKYTQLNSAKLPSLTFSVYILALFKKCGEVSILHDDRGSSLHNTTTDVNDSNGGFLSSVKSDS
jgi:hypothetical protein